MSMSGNNQIEEVRKIYETLSEENKENLAELIVSLFVSQELDRPSPYQEPSEDSSGTGSEE